MGHEGSDTDSQERRQGPREEGHAHTTRRAHTHAHLAHAAHMLPRAHTLMSYCAAHTHAAPASPGGRRRAGGWLSWDAPRWSPVCHCLPASWPQASRCIRGPAGVPCQLPVLPVPRKPSLMGPVSVEATGVLGLGFTSWETVMPEGGCAGSRAAAHVDARLSLKTGSASPPPPPR